MKTDSNFFLIKQIEKLGEDKDMYIPYHLIKGMNIQYYPDYENAYPKTTEHEVYGTIDDFFDFYKELEQSERE